MPAILLLQLRELNCSAVIHMDPVCVNDEETNKVKEKAAEIIGGMEGDVRFHELDENYFVVIDVDKECR